MHIGKPGTGYDVAQYYAEPRARMSAGYSLLNFPLAVVTSASTWPGHAVRGEHAGLRGLRRELHGRADLCALCVASSPPVLSMSGISFRRLRPRWGFSDGEDCDSCEPGDAAGTELHAARFARKHSRPRGADGLPGVM
jgi:hypothetical protein